MKSRWNNVCSYKGMARTALRLPQPARLDPYRTQLKPRGTPQCRICHSYSIQGRWVSEDEAHITSPTLKKPARAIKQITCPACQKLKDRYAASVVELRGTAWQANSEQILNTLHHTEEIARARNEQGRILWFENDKEITRVYVTLPELARQMGAVLRQTFKGTTKFHKGHEEPFLRVIWSLDPIEKSPKARLTKSKHRRNRGARRSPPR